MRTILFGCKGGGSRCLEYLVAENKDIAAVVTVDDRNDPYRVGESVLEVANKYKIPTFLPKSTKDKSFISQIKYIRPELLLSVYYDKKISKEILKMCKLGINFHGGKLPNYKGCLSNVWSIINGESETAATAHILEEKFDTGDVVGEVVVPILGFETGRTVYFKTEDATSELFKKTLRKIEAGKLTRTTQPKGGTYYNKRLPNDGIANINWTDKQLYDFTRALYFPPFPPTKFARNFSEYPLGGNKK